MKARYDSRPLVIQRLNANAWLYNYNIVQVSETDQQTGKVTISFKCDQITFYGEPTRKKITAVIIAEEYSNDKEKELINDYLAYKAGILTQAANETRYIDFLNRRKEIKLMVKNDVNIKSEE